MYQKIRVISGFYLANNSEFEPKFAKDPDSRILRTVIRHSSIVYVEWVVGERAGKKCNGNLEVFITSRSSFSPTKHQRLHLANK